MTWETLLRIALGQLGWKEHEFWNASFKALFLAIEGFYELQNAREKEEWIRAQFISYHAILPYIPRGKHDKVRRQIFFFKDEKEQPPRLTREEIKARFGKWDAEHKAKYKAKETK